MTAAMFWSGFASGAVSGIAGYILADAYSRWNARRIARRQGEAAERAAGGNA